MNITNFRIFSILLVIATCHSIRFWNILAAWNIKYMMFPNGPAPLLRTLTSDNAEWLRLKEAEECAGDKDYRGYRWVSPGTQDTLALLFDEAGYIAGIQPKIPIEEAHGIGISPDNIPSPFVRDPSLEFYYFTIYFVDPAKICRTGRTQEEFKAQGTGTDLKLLDGDKIITVPRNESDITSPWVKGGCFHGLGRHYWYDNFGYMNCDNLFPVVPLYNGGDLNGFAISYAGHLEGDLYYHPTGKSDIKSGWINHLRKFPTLTLKGYFKQIYNKKVKS